MNQRSGVSDLSDRAYIRDRKWEENSQEGPSQEPVADR